MKRSESKEAVRLWYECLRRAEQEPALQLNRDYYAQWGSTADKSFNKWWLEKGQSLFERSQPQIHKGKQAPDGCVLVAVPLSMTPTDAGNAVRVLLTKHVETTNHKSKKTHVYRFTERREIKVASIRAYLHTYDAYMRLLAVGIKKNEKPTKGKHAKGITLPAKDLLTEIRRFYLKRSDQWSRRKVKVKVDTLPIALSQGMTLNPYTGDAVTYGGEERAAIQSVLRYLRSAQELIANAAKGDWPGR